ncbi:S-antigen; retina and pineal gland (arrestin) a [Electrophorus electricus]|uniref:S-antigen; retina and pineal gland (arrestin) a n=1 Tax=Electrophorus electricus TaxID=8005 RepID=UPI0015D07A2E|nr:S-antigen; retina and pineal gland (arrestin) a [Electrophorus electricus]
MSPKSVVYKKMCKDKSVGVYMGKRDFIDRVDSVEPVDGVILIDPVLLKGKKVYVTLACTFRYGKDDMDILGITFRRDIYLCTRQVYPALQDKEQCTLTKVQEKLLQKLGENGYPFFFEFPDNLPCSVYLQPAPTDVGKHCAIEFEVKVFSAESQDAKVHKRSTVRLMIRKVQYAPENLGPAPSVSFTRNFLMSDKPMHVEASLEKQTYYHGEPIKVLVKINNESNRTVKNIILSVDQTANVVLYSNDSYMKTVATEDSGDSLGQGGKMEKVYTLLPLLANNKERRGIVLDGKLKHEDTNLASTSLIKKGVLKEVLGILVSYRITVKLIVGTGLIGFSEIGLELPFQLMHPNPDSVKESEDDEEVVFEEFKRSNVKGMGEDNEGNVSAGEQ